MFSLGLPIYLFPSNFPVVILYSHFPFLIKELCPTYEDFILDPLLELLQCYEFHTVQNAVTN